MLFSSALLAAATALTAAQAPPPAPAEPQAVEEAPAPLLGLPAPCVSAFDSPAAPPWTRFVTDFAKDRRIVGLGECSHYTKECYDLKGTAIQALMGAGFGGLVLEVDFGQGMIWNDYVTGRSDDLDGCVQRSAWFTYRTAEFRGILAAIRAHNDAAEVPFQVLGMEMTTIGSGLDWLAQRAEASEVFDDEAGRSWVQSLRAERKNVAFQAHTPDEQRAAWELFHRSRSLFAARRAAFVDECGEPNASCVDRFVEVMRQYATYVAQEDTGLQVELRDQFSSRNVLWCLDQLGEGSRVVLWAHNGHVRRPSPESYAVVGHHLRRWFGDEYGALGFTFNEGEVGTFGNEGFYFPSFERADASTLTGRLAQMGSPFLAMDLAGALRAAPAATAWLKEPQSMRAELGEFFPKDRAHIASLAPAVLYDALVYIDVATRPERLDWIR